MTAVHDHNARQRRYFETGLKQSMVPRDTPYVRRQVDELLRFAPVHASDRVIEIGCGMGRYTLPLLRRGLTVEGLDLSPVLLERLQEYAGASTRLRLHCHDVLSLPSDMFAQYDAVIGFFTLHHLHDVKACLASMARLLRPGGRLVFLEPNPFNVLYYAQITLTPGMTWEGDGGIVHMRPSIILRGMRQAGLTGLATRRFGFFPPALANRDWGQALERRFEAFPLWRPFLPFQLFRGERPRSA